MRELEMTKQKSMYAGGLSAGAYAAIVAGISLLIGIIDGFARPIGCR